MGTVQWLALIFVLVVVGGLAYSWGRQDEASREADHERREAWREFAGAVEKTRNDPEFQRAKHATERAQEEGEQQMEEVRRRLRSDRERNRDRDRTQLEQVKQFERDHPDNHDVSELREMLERRLEDLGRDERIT